MESINSNELNFSKSALNHFNDALMQRGKGNGVKLGIKKAGCSGYEYTFEYVDNICLLYTSPSPRDQRGSRMPSSA